MKKILAVMIGIVMLSSFAGCGKRAEMPTGSVAESTTTGSESESGATTVVTVTDAAGVPVTKADGTVETRTVPAATAGEAAPSGDTAQPTATDKATAAAEKTDAAAKKTNAATAAPTTKKPAVTAAPTTKKPAAAPAAKTTQKPTTTTTKATAAPTAAPTKAPTQPAEKDPWKYPYDVAEITRQCREIIEKADARFVWDDSLTVDNAGWNNPTYTGYYTDHPNSLLTLKEEMENDFLPYEIEEHQRLGYFQYKIYLEPDPKNKGDYSIYWLYL